MKKLVLFSVFVHVCFAGLAQVKIGTPAGAPHPSAMFEVQSDNRGLLPPRLTERDRTGIRNPAEGLLVYDLTQKAVMLFNGSQWESLGAAPEGIGVIVVDAAGSGQFTTISAALASVNPTKAAPVLIYIKPGQYQEHVVLKSYVTLRGAYTAGVRLLGLGPGGGAQILPAMLANNRLGIRIEKMTIKPAEPANRANTGIQVIESEAEINDVVLEAFSDVIRLRIGVEAQQSTFHMHQSRLLNIENHAVVLQQSKATLGDCRLHSSLDHITVSNGSEATVSHCHFKFGNWGIAIENGGKALAQGCRFDSVGGAARNYGNLQFVGNVVEGVDPNSGLVLYSKSVVSGNRFTNCKPRAIMDFSNGQSIISTNIIENSAQVGEQAIGMNNSGSQLVGNVFAGNTAGDISITGAGIPLLIGTEGQISGNSPIRVGIAGNGPVRIEREGDHLITALPTGANVGIGLTNPQHKLHLQDATSTRGIFVNHTATTGTRYGLWAITAAISGTGLRGDATHNTGATVGVMGTVSSTSGTAVLGQANAGTGTTYGVQGFSSSTSGRALYGFATALSGTTYGLYAQTNSNTGYAGYFVGGRNYFQGRVGIGTNAPANLLHLQDGSNNLLLGSNLIRQQSGNLEIDALSSLSLSAANTFTLSGSADLNMSASGKMNISSIQDISISNAAGTTSLSGNLGLNLSSGSGHLRLNNLVTVVQNLGVGIGTNNPGAFTLAVSGGAAKTGGGSWSVFSDARLKQNIEKVENGMLQKLLRLNTYQFEYRPEAIAGKLALPGRQTGLLAQEVLQVFPDWVDTDSSGYMYITERALTAIMAQAMRELKAEKDGEIERLEKANAALEERIKRLELK
jgi:hypothetical protein